MYACVLTLFQRPAKRNINSVTIQPDRDDLHVLECCGNSKDMDLDNESTEKESEFYYLEENIMQENKNIIVNKPTFDWPFVFYSLLM